jgi:hypothetical protein
VRPDPRQAGQGYGRCTPRIVWSTALEDSPSSRVQGRSSVPEPTTCPHPLQRSQNFESFIAPEPVDDLRDPEQQDEREAALVTFTRGIPI